MALVWYCKPSCFFGLLSQPLPSLPLKSILLFGVVGASVCSWLIAWSNSLVGPLTSFVVGAVGTVVWWLVPQGFFLAPWAAAFMAAGFLTALYNCVPFFRTDGYFALSDWVGIPNLDRKAHRYVLQTLLRPFRRHPGPTHRLSFRQHLVFAVYGVSALLATGWVALMVLGFCWWIFVSVVLSHL